MYERLGLPLPVFAQSCLFSSRSPARLIDADSIAMKYKGTGRVIRCWWGKLAQLENLSGPTKGIRNQHLERFLGPPEGVPRLSHPSSSGLLHGQRERKKGKKPGRQAGRQTTSYIWLHVTSRFSNRQWAMVTFTSFFKRGTSLGQVPSEHLSPVDLREWI